MTQDQNFKGKLGNYSFINTLDGSITLHSDFFDENFHNLKGAYEETLYTYINGSKLSRIFEPSPNLSFSLLEVGFGMGLGLYSIDKYIQKNLNLNNKKTHLYFLSFEIDAELISWQIKNEIDKKNLYSPTVLPTLDKWSFKQIGDLQFYQVDHRVNDFFMFSGVLLIGDGRKVLKSWFASQKNTDISWPKFHAIFQDAFSPKKNPDLWTMEWFKELNNCSQNDVILSTYSSATAIRQSLHQAGWLVHNQKGFAHKKAMTLATLSEKTLGPMPSGILEKLLKSPIEPYRDFDQQEFILKRDNQMTKKFI